MVCFYNWCLRNAHIIFLLAETKWSRNFEGQLQISRNVQDSTWITNWIFKKNPHTSEMFRIKKKKILELLELRPLIDKTGTLVLILRILTYGVIPGPSYFMILLVIA